MPRGVVWYFVAAFALSWSVGVPLALQQQGVTGTWLPQWTHYLLAYGPALAALAVTGAAEGRAGLGRLLARVARWNIGGWWWLAAFSPLVAGALAGLALDAWQGAGIRVADLGAVHFLPPLGLAALPLWLVTFGIGEELGWRGFALPRLQRQHGAVAATAILAAAWALWHLPQFFYLYAPAMAAGWLVSLFAGAIVFTWLFNGTRGSVLAVAVFHGCFDTVTSSVAGNGALATSVSVLVMVAAVLIVAVYGPRDLARVERVRA